MNIEPGETLEITGDHASIREGDVTRACFSLQGHDALKAAIWDVAKAALGAGLESLFRRECGRCGACCTRLPVYVRAHEIYAIRRHLGLKSDGEFRRAYMEPSETWNEFDGILRKADGACPFLRRAGRGRPAACIVYPVRPAACAAQQPSPGLCRRAPEKLFESLRLIQLQRGVLTFTSTDGELLVIDVPRPALRRGIERLHEALARTEDLRGAKVEKIVRNAHRMLDDLLASSGTFRAREQEVRNLLNYLTRYLALRNEDCARATALWDKFRLLEERALRHESRSTIDEPGEASGQGEAPPGLTLFPFGALACDVPGGARWLLYADHPHLAEAAGALLREISCFCADEVQDLITETAAPCYQCGQCCSQNAVEITALDVESLAHHLGITEHAFRKRHTGASPFSWNRGRVVLTKRDGFCTFLEKKSEHNYSCTVYEARPHICKAYSSRSRLCIQENRVVFWHRQASNITRVDILPGELQITTAQTLERERKPLSLAMDAHTSLGRCACAARDACAGALRLQQQSGAPHRREPV